MAALHYATCSYKDVGVAGRKMDANYLYVGVQNDKKYIFGVITERK
jgi:hypothetical protein